MMGLGYFGSSSSSSLSPLAPPFTVDRSNPNKPDSNSNLVVSSYGVPFSSSWPYPHSSQDILADSIRTATVPCASDYGYVSSNPINPPSPNWSAINPSSKSVADSISYNFNETKPYNPPYASAMTNDDIPSVALNEPSYDLLCTSGLFHGDSGGSSQIDHKSTQSLFEFEYNPQWGSIWSGAPEGKRGKTVESDDKFFPKEATIAGSLASKNYINQGAYGTDTLGKGRENTAIFPGSYTDVFRRENYIGPSIIGKSDNAPFSAENQEHFPNEFSKAPPFKPFPMFSESHPLVPSPEPLEEPWKTQNSYPLYERRFHIFDSSNDQILPLTKASPSLVIKPPIDFEPKGSFIASNQQEIANKLPMDDRLTFEFKAKSHSQVPEVNIQKVESTENVKSVANSSENLDHHNPAEDSPCWKGAQSSHHIIKPNKGYGFLSETITDAKSQTSQLKLPNDAANPATAAKRKDINVVVEELQNLSELLLFCCSKDECALKEQDYEALDHVSANLKACMSRKIQQVAPTQKFMLPHQSTSNTSQMTNETTGTFHGKTGHWCPHYQKRNDICGKSIEKLQDCVSPRDNSDLPKDHNTIQAIKKILDENLECEEKLPSQTLLYKNLWLEAEAELCAFNYKARFERMKIQMNCKSDKATVSDVSEINAAMNTSSSSPNQKISPKLMHEADGSKISNTHVKNAPFSGGVQIDDVEASVMARFNILKSRGVTNSINVEEQESADVVSGKKCQSPGVTVAPHLQHHRGIDDTLVMDPSVMARLNILNNRINSNPVNDEEQQLADDDLDEIIGEECQSSGVSMGTCSPHQAGKEAVGMSSKEMQNQYESESGWYNANYTTSNWENILKDEFSWQPMGA